MKEILLVVTSTFPRWRNDTDPPFVYELSKRLAETFDVTIHTPHYPGSSKSERIDGMYIHRFRYFFTFFERLAGGQGIVPKMRRNRMYLLLLPFFLCAQFFSLLLLVANLRPRVIHVHWLVPQGLWAILIKKIFNIPVVITAHGADVFALRNVFLIKLKRWIVNNADRVVTVSSALAQESIFDGPRVPHVDIIPMGVDGSLFSPETRSETLRDQYGIQGPFLLFVGRFTEKKGVRYLIDAMALVSGIFPDARLLLVGHGELELELREQVRLLDLEEVVIFVGAIENNRLPVYYATADIYIGPSVQTADGDTEGLGLTFIEAAMSGCLVVGTSAGGIKEVITHGKNGYIVQPGDARSLADTILSILQRPIDFSEIKTFGRQTALQHFEWKKIAHRYEKLLRDVSTTGR